MLQLILFIDLICSKKKEYVQEFGNMIGDNVNTSMQHIYAT